MNRSIWIGTALLALLVTNASAVETGLVTAISGTVKFKEERSSVSTLKAFTKLRDGDRIIMDGVSRVQIVYFDGGLQETLAWYRGNRYRQHLEQEDQGQPAIGNQDLTGHSCQTADQNAFGRRQRKTGMVRLRSIPSSEKTRAAENEYEQLRNQASLARSDWYRALARLFERYDFLCCCPAHKCSLSMHNSPGHASSGANHGHLSSLDGGGDRPHIGRPAEHECAGGLQPPWLAHGLADHWPGPGGSRRAATGVCP